jgi:Na+-driven multidrug efflux pump
LSDRTLGAKKYDRVKKGVHATLILSIVTVVILGGVVFAFAEPCISFFSKDPEVIRAGATCIKVMCPFYFALCLHQVWSGALRASGRSSVPMITSIMAFVVIRQIFLMIVLNLYHDISIIGWGYSVDLDPGCVLYRLLLFHSHWLKEEEARDKI